MSQYKRTLYHLGDSLSSCKLEGGRILNATANFRVRKAQFEISIRYSLREIDFNFGEKRSKCVQKKLLDIFGKIR